MFIQLLADDLDKCYLILKDPFRFSCAMILVSFETVTWLYAIYLKIQEVNLFR